MVAVLVSVPVMLNVMVMEGDEVLLSPPSPLNRPRLLDTALLEVGEDVMDALLTMEGLLIAECD